MSGAANPLEKVLRDVIRNLGARRPGEEEIAALWERVAGEAAARHSRPVSFRKSVLVVNVDTSGWLYELTLKKKEMLTQLEKDLKGKKRVRDIRFRIGAVTAPAGGGRD